MVVGHLTRARAFSLLAVVAVAALSAMAFIMTPDSFRMVITDPAQRFAYQNSNSQGCQGQVDGKGGHGVSGRVFQGKPVRDFTGPLRFHDGSTTPSPATPTLPADAITSKKWAVCTTIHQPTQAILDFVQQETEWAIVVVGDEGMEPFEIQGNKAVFLDAQAQRDMSAGYQAFFRLLPWKHFGRKNVGYLYAILHGAEQVWDFDDDNFLMPGTFPTVPVAARTREVVVSEDCPAFNPLPSMGGEGLPNPMWPRGFPLNAIHSPCPFTLVPYNGGHGHGQPDKTAVYQSLADNEPDVDGIYRLTRTTPMTFTRSTSPEGDLTLSIPPGSLSPYNAQATLLLQPALWSLLLPVTIHGRVSDIWRSYIAQRLLWDAGYQIAFTPPMVVQYRNAHNYLADMQAEEDLYFKAPAMVEVLRSWRGKASTLAGRYEELMVTLYERGFVEAEDVLLTQEWLDVLGQVGYSLPPLSPEDWTTGLPPSPSSPAKARARARSVEEVATSPSPSAPAGVGVGVGLAHLSPLSPPPRRLPLTSTSTTSTSTSTRSTPSEAEDGNSKGGPNRSIRNKSNPRRRLRLGAGGGGSQSGSLGSDDGRGLASRRPVN